MLTYKQQLSNLIQGEPLPETEPIFNAELLTTSELKAVRVLLAKAQASGMESLTDGELDELQGYIEKAEQ